MEPYHQDRKRTYQRGGRQKKTEETVLFLSCEKGISIGLEQGLERGAYQTKLETARNLLSEGWLPRWWPAAPASRWRPCSS